MLKLYFPQVRVDAAENLFNDEAPGIRATFHDRLSGFRRWKREIVARHKGRERVTGILWEFELRYFAIGVCGDFREQITKLTDHAIYSDRLVEIAVVFAGYPPAIGALHHKKVQIVNGAR